MILCHLNMVKIGKGRHSEMGLAESLIDKYLGEGSNRDVADKLSKGLNAMKQALSAGTTSYLFKNASDAKKLADKLDDKGVKYSYVKGRTNEIKVKD